jgi:hypothetical protein
MHAQRPHAPCWQLSAASEVTLHFAPRYAASCVLSSAAAAVMSTETADVACMARCAVHGVAMPSQCSDQRNPEALCKPQLMQHANSCTNTSVRHQHELLATNMFAAGLQLPDGFVYRAPGWHTFKRDTHYPEVPERCQKRRIVRQQQIQSAGSHTLQSTQDQTLRRMQCRQNPAGYNSLHR